MNQNTPKLDYLAPDVSELAMQPGRLRGHQTARAKLGRDAMTPVMAKRLLPACVVVPALLWWGLLAGVHHGWYQLETSLALFVFSVAAVFGIIVCLNLRKLWYMDRERAQTQEQLKLAKEAAEAANRFKTVFFANISHEVRTPLTAINGFAELLLNPQRTTEQRLADARVIRRNGEHLLTLINDILDISKIEAGKMSVDRIGCSPAKIVGEVRSMLAQRAAEKGLELNVKFDGPIPKMIRTDPTRLRQILINLVANGIKFTSEGGVTLNVSIKSSLDSAKPLLEVKITDTGMGIAPEQQSSLFQAFVQGDATITRRYGGSGLGLAISRHFAQALGGDITVSSEPGRGSTFTVTIETDSLAEVEFEDRPEDAAHTQDEFTTPQVRIKGSVLIAEDGLDNQALIVERLKETGLKLDIAPNGQIACEKAIQAQTCGEPFDLILMDVQMPVMDGFAATLELRSKGYRGPIIALTANAMDRDRSKCLNAGCNDFVTKPIQMEKLLAAIGRFLKVVKVSSKPSLIQDAGAVSVDLAAAAEKFYQELPAELAQTQQALDRQDRVRLKEVSQLLLGKAAAAGLSDVALQAAKLLNCVESEESWIVLRQAADEFANELRAAIERQAA